MQLFGGKPKPEFEFSSLAVDIYSSACLVIVNLLTTHVPCHADNKVHKRVVRTRLPSTLSV